MTCPQPLPIPDEDGARPRATRRHLSLVTADTVSRAGTEVETGGGCGCERDAFDTYTIY